MRELSNDVVWRGKAPGHPKVTIITACLNAVDGLTTTLASLRSQTCQDFEWLVADGQSTDGSVDFLINNNTYLRWISATDSGLYEAWNRACLQSRGEWLIFLGAGDVLAGPDVLAQVKNDLHFAMPKHPLVYGRLAYLSPKQRKVIEEVGKPWSEMVGRWEIGRPALPPHGAVFHHRSLFSSSTPFDTSYRIAADSAFLLKVIQTHSPLHIPLRIACAPIGGVSFQLGDMTRLQTELNQINCSLGLCPPLHHSIAIAATNLVKSLLSYLPHTWQTYLMDAARVLLGKPRRWTVK